MCGAGALRQLFDCASKGSHLHVIRNCQNMVVCLLEAFLECLVDLRTGLVVDSRRIALDFLVGSNQTVSKIDDDIYKRFDGRVQGVVVKMICERPIR